jgi:hypothetical protein
MSGIMPRGMEHDGTAPKDDKMQKAGLLVLLLVFVGLIGGASVIWWFVLTP